MANPPAYRIPTTLLHLHSLNLSPRLTRHRHHLLDLASLHEKNHMQISPNELINPFRSIELNLGNTV
jgi:hypothetical protein